MIEHGDVRETLELAAAEPGGLDRLEAGDAPEAALVVGHLAGCPGCLEELARLRRAESILRPIIRELPDPALRERTLAFVREVGVPRGEGAASRPGAAPAVAASAAAPALGTPAVAAPARPRPRVTTPAWLGALAAVLVVGFVGGSLLAGGGAVGPADPATALAAVTQETAAVLAAGDARQIALVGDGEASGVLALSPSADRVVVAAAGLPAPAPGEEYRCWVEVGGARTVLGTMWWAGDVAWWAGDVALPAVLPPGVRYGVSRVSEGSSSPGTVVLAGEL